MNAGLAGTYLENLLRNETVKISLILLVSVIIAYPQITFSNKSLIPTLYVQQNVTEYGLQTKAKRLPAPVLDMDISTAAYYEFPINKLVGDIYKKFELPLWNGHQGLGTPLAGQYSTRAFFPYQILENVSPYWLWDYFILFRLWIAGFFTFIFLRHIHLSFFASTCGALMYMFCGSLTQFISLEQFMNVAMLIPAGLWALDRLLRSPNLRNIGILGIAIAALITAGQPEILFYAVILYFFYFLYRTSTNNDTIKALCMGTLRISGASLIGLGISFPLLILFFNAVTNSYHGHIPGAGLGTYAPIPWELSAYFLVPNLREVGHFGLLTPIPGTWDYLGGYTGVILLLFAAFGITKVGKHRRLAQLFFLFASIIIAKNFGIWPVEYIGNLPLFEQVWSNRWAAPVWAFALTICASIGLDSITAHNFNWQIKRSTSKNKLTKLAVNTLNNRFLLWLGIIFIFASLLYGFYENSIYLNLETDPRLYVSLWPSATYAFLAIFGTACSSLHLSRNHPDGVRDTAYMIGGLSIVLIIFVILRNITDPGLSTDLWDRMTFLITTMMLTIAGIIYVKIRTSNHQRLKLCLLVIVSAELFMYIPRGYSIEQHAFQFLPVIAGIIIMGFLLFTRVKILFLSLLIIPFIGLFIILDSQAEYGLPPRENPFKSAIHDQIARLDHESYRILGDKHNLPPNFAGTMNVNDIRFIDTFTPSATHAFVNDHLRTSRSDEDFVDVLWFTGSQQPTAEEKQDEFFTSFLERTTAYSLLGVKYLVTNHLFQNVGIPLIDSGETNIYQNSKALPSTFLVQNLEFAPTAITAMEKAVMLDERLINTGVVENSILLGQMNHAANSEVSSTKVIEIKTNSRTIEVNTDIKKMLVINQVHFPGWKAMVDGEPVQIHRINGLLKGVAVDPGQHTVKLEFIPEYLQLSKIIFILAALTCFFTLTPLPSRLHKIIFTRSDSHNKQI